MLLFPRVLSKHQTSMAKAVEIRSYYGHNPYSRFIDG